MFKLSSSFSSSLMRMNIRNKNYFNLTSNKFVKGRFLNTTNTTNTTTTPETITITPPTISTSGKVFLTLSLLGVFVISNYHNIKDLYTNSMKLLFKKDLEHSTIEAYRSKDEYVERKEVEKSELITQCANGEKYAVKIIISPFLFFAKVNIMELILKHIKNDESTNTSLTLGEIETQMRKLNKENIYPIIIFDIVRNNDNELSTSILTGIRSLCKFLASFCHCFIVISNVADVTVFGNDVSREYFVFVDELSVEEAKEFIKKNTPYYIHNRVKVFFMKKDHSITDEEAKEFLKKN